MHPTRAAYGVGVLRSDEGVWLGGLLANMGSATITLAELQAIREGMLPAAQLNIKYLLVELDSLCAVKLIKSGDTSHPYGQVVNDCRELCCHFHRVKFAHGMTHEEM